MTFITKLSVISISVLLAGAVAQAETVNYRGEGRYRPLEGAHMTYTDATTIEKLSESKKKITSVYTFTRGGEARSMTVTYFKVKRERNFFDVLNSSEEKVGDGYCFGRRDRTKTCHMNVEMSGVEIEETTTHRGNIRRVMGSMRRNGDFVAAYRARLTKVEAED